MPPGAALFQIGHRVGRLGDTAVAGSRPQRPGVAGPVLDLDQLADRAFVNELFHLVQVGAPGDRPVDQQTDPGGPGIAHHRQGVAVAHRHRLLDADIDAAQRAVLDDLAVPDIFRGDDRQVRLFRFQHGDIVVVDLFDAVMFAHEAQVPAPCIRPLVNFRHGRNRVGTGRQPDFRMGVKTGGHLVDVHVGKADDDDLIAILFHFTPSSSPTRTSRPVLAER